MKNEPSTVLVTGGSRGIGAAAAWQLAQQGRAVDVNYTRDAAAADRLVGRERLALDGGVDVRRDPRRQDVLRAARRILAFVIVKLLRGLDLDHAQGSIAHHGAGQLAPVDVALDHD